MIEYNKNELKEALTAVAQDMVLDEGLGKGKLKFRIHADGSRQKRREGQTAGQTTKNANNRSTGKRKRSAIKTVRSKMKKFGKAISTKSAKLIKRAKAKRAARGL